MHAARIPATWRERTGRGTPSASGVAGLALEMPALPPGRASRERENSSRQSGTVFHWDESAPMPALPAGRRERACRARLCLVAGGADR